VKQVGERRIVIADSAAEMGEDSGHDIFVDGSHCGSNVGEMALHAHVLGMIGNDAGLGKNDAGIAMSAKIGSGDSTYEQGVISAVNEVAKKLGVAVGMSAREAAEKMLAAP
jgi:hypothetical protein